MTRDDVEDWNDALGDEVTVTGEEVQDALDESDWEPTTDDDEPGLGELDQYDESEIRDAVDVGSIMIDTYVDKRFTTTVETGFENGEERRVPREREELKWLAGNIGGGKQITVHVRVLDVRERKAGSADVLVADETAATTVEIPAQLRPSGDEQPDPVNEFAPGDSLLIENVDTVDARANDHYSTLRYGFDAEVTVCDEWDRPERVPVGVTVSEKSDLVNDAERYSYEEAHVARERVVDTIVDEFHIKHVMPTDQTWMWVDEIAWVLDADKRLKSILQDVLPSRSNTRNERNEIVEQVQLATQTDENPFAPGPPDDPDLKWCVPVQNGLIDLREPADQEPIPHAPEHYTTLQELLAVAHDPGAECTGIDANLDKIATDDIMKATIEEMMANMLMRNNDYRKSYVKIGDNETGKSFSDTLMKWLIGDDGIEHMDFTKFVSDDFEGDASRNSYAVIDDDASDKKISSAQCSAFKKYLGIGGVRTAAKYDKRESHDPYATIIFDVNHPPVWQDWDGSIKSRLMPLFYCNQFVASPDPDDPRQHQEKKQSQLERELKTDEELAGLLNQLIEAANRLHETGEWSIYEQYYEDMPSRDPDEAHEKIMQKYRNYADTTRQFGRGFMTEVSEPVEVRKDDWHTLYRRMCEDEGIEPQEPSPFWTQLRNDDSLYFETKNPYQSPRVTKYVAPTKKALRYAPGPVKERIQSLVAAPGFNVGVDETTPVSDLPSRSDYVTVEGECVTKTLDRHPKTGDEHLVFVLEDESGGRVSVLKPTAYVEDETDVMDAFDSVLEGDTVRVHSGIKLSGCPYVRLQDGSSSIDIVARPDGRPEWDSNASDDDECEGDELSQEDRVNTVSNVIGSLQNRTDVKGGATVERVIEACEDRGIDAAKAEHDIERLKQKGDAYAPVDGRIKTTGGD